MVLKLTNINNLKLTNIKDILHSNYIQASLFLILLENRRNNNLISFGNL